MKAKPTEQEVAALMAPEPNLDRDIGLIIATLRLLAGSMFAACGADALSEDTILVELIERENNKTEKERARFQAAGTAIPARHYTLGSKELKTSSGSAFAHLYH